MTLAFLNISATVAALLGLLAVLLTWRWLILALGVVLLIARLASAWGLSHSLGLSTGRKAGAGLTSLVVVACSLLVLYRMLVML